MLFIPICSLRPVFTLKMMIPAASLSEVVGVSESA